MDAVRVLHGEGAQEEQWQDCHWLWRQPRTSLRRLLAGAQRVVVVAPHPDDEILACGGLMAGAALRGVAVQVVAVTDGEACYPDEPWWTPTRLRHARRQELREALAELGVDGRATLHLGIADGAVAGHEQGLTDWLGQTLRADDLVLAPWKFDGHPDHEAASRAARTASRALGCKYMEYPVWGWHWLDPGCAHLAWESPQVLDITAFATCKQRAIRQFRTQTGEVEQLQSPPILPAHVLARFQRSHEVFLP